MGSTITVGRFTIRNRRRRDLMGRVSRAVWPAGQAIEDFIVGFPCNMIGHRDVEVPQSLLSARARANGRMRFKCSRCYLMGGFSNR